MHIGITVSDLDAFENFYKSVFGFEKAKNDIEQDDKIIRFLKKDNLWLEFIKYKKEVQEQENKGNDILGYRHIALWVDDMDEFYNHVKSLDVKSKEPKSYPSGEKRVKIWDPDGNMIEVYSR
jgi:catechol 2,3-dioxygenase-like lactoylglutathione lyase family enzyme